MSKMKAFGFVFIGFLTFTSVSAIASGTNPLFHAMAVAERHASGGKAIVAAVAERHASGGKAIVAAVAERHAAPTDKNVKIAKSVALDINQE
jgi:hypothetical protein